MSWEDWLINNGHSNDMSMLDKLLELAVNSYDVGTKSRKMDIIDRKHFLVLWWEEHKDYFTKYHTLTSLGILINIDHATVIHYKKRRKKSRLFNDNTKCIRDFLNS
jgi:hypothetical protein